MPGKRIDGSLVATCGARKIEGSGTEPRASVAPEALLPLLGRLSLSAATFSNDRSPAAILLEGLVRSGRVNWKCQDQSSPRRRVYSPSPSGAIRRSENLWVRILSTSHVALVLMPTGKNSVSIWSRMALLGDRQSVTCQRLWSVRTRGCRL